MIGAILTAGSMIVTWLGEQITDKGYGNGVSMIIFAGIVASIPDMIKGIYVDYFVNVPSDRLNSSLIFCRNFNRSCLVDYLFHNICATSRI